ncbi:MAG: hypothetical protein N2450_07775 [bacterium]|nr:hypothetical protein [bacterium]
MWKKWLSRKLLMTLAGLLTTVFIQYLGLTPEAAKEMVEAIMVILSSYLLGQSAVDIVQVLKEKPSRNRSNMLF